MMHMVVVLFIVGVLVHRGGSAGVVSCPNNHLFSTGDYNVNLTALGGVWETVSIEATDINPDITVAKFFNISLLGTFQIDPCKGHHICYTETFDSFYVMGKSGSCKYHSEDRTISLIYDYENTFGSGNVTITLVCGSSLGVPEVLEGDPRTHAVEMVWITSAACQKEDNDSKIDETKCYKLQHTIDRENGIEAEFIDLSGLIQNVGYEATMADRPDIIMNVSVCRPMKSDNECDGSMACLYQGDSHINITGHTWPLPLGFISSGSSDESFPHYESGVLTMIFPIKKENANCNGGSPFVKLRFFCPKGDEALGPYIEYLDNNLCVIIIVWNTMHACDIKTIQSTGLTLNTPQGTSFDLRGLPEVTITDTVNTHTYSYSIHPSTTGSLNSGCQDDNNDPIHVMQTQNGSAVCWSLGEGIGKLRYIDNILTLTYSRGDTCHNGYARTSIITFICPNDVVGGVAHCDLNNASKCVTFNFESHCLYEFEWVTDLACGTSSPTSTCRFKLNGIDYNLGLLTEDYKSTYAAIASDDVTECYLINPCGNVEVTALSNLTSTQYCNQKVAPQEFCDQSSVCYIPKVSSEQAHSLGSFHLDDSSLLHTVVRDVVSVATKPHKSGAEKHQAVVHYVCQTGTLLTSPVFISQDQNSIAEFHWYTFAACPQGVSVGSDCTVTQPSTGFTFNLSSISNKIFNFTDQLHHYKYSVRVCKAFADNTFEDSCSSDSAVCQHVGSHHNSAGKPNSTLIYADSAIKLSYLEGKKCSVGERHSTIVFLCNPNTHTPKIQNITEIQHCSYVIEMETKLACPPAYRSSECVYFSPSGDSYDLTQLERTVGNWQAEGSDGTVYLINICRPLNLQGISHCNPLSAVCRKTKASGSVPNQDLGLASTASFGPPPKSADSHVTLVLNYTYPLNSDTGCPKIYTSIRFVCNRTAPLNAGPRHLSGGGSADPCEYLFLWETRVVCPVEREVVKACNITDEATGYTFDLQPLKTRNNNLYTVQGSDSTSYNLTLCDILTEDDSLCPEKKISVCQTDSHGNHHSSGTYASMELTYIEESLTLKYKDGKSCSGGDSRTTEIDFLCDRFAGDDYFGQPKFVSESSHCHYLFEWPTALACPPTKLTCLAQGGKYNLQPLLETRNWFISGSKGRKYVIGGCQSIDASSIPECTSSVDVGACLYTPNSGKKGDILGYVTGDLIEISEGHLKLSYHNGKMCSSGIKSVVNVHFHCKAGGGAGNPVLDSSGCVTEIRWDTQYACPQDNATSGWVITNPSSGQTYDLTKLSPVLSSQHAGYNYTVGLAGHTVPCGNKKNATICQKKIGADNSYVLARKGGTLELVGGKVQLTSQNGDQCHHHGQMNRKATIYFEYDPRDDFLMVLPEQGCEYSFVVFTKLVKEEKQEIGVQCYLESFPDLEWFTSFPTPPLLVESGSAKVYFSVCNPISSGNQEANDGFESCNTVTGACYVKGSEVINLGRPSVHYPPTVSPDGNAVLITYVGGDKCKHTKKTFTTKILLVCSNSTGKIPDVTYFNTTSCEVVITWPSPHACPLQVPMTKVSDSVCSIVDPSDGTTLDLQPLTDGTQVMSADGKYTIGLCGPIQRGDEACSSNHVGICHKSDNRWMKMADANHSLTIVSHSPHAVDVLYPTGKSCGNHMTWTVKIHIYCSHKNNSQHPFLESSGGCELTFTWPTSALCLTEVEGCYVRYPDNTILDLEPLVSQSWKGGYLGDGKRLGEFNVSICRNLNPTSSEGRQCFPGPTGICFQPDVGKNNYKNLGHMVAPPAISSNGEITLKYEKGDACGTSSGSNISTTVYLKCPDTDFEAAPQLLQLSDCKYRIDWSTRVACKQNKEESGSCVVNDPHSSVQYNFESLAKQLSFQDGSDSYSVCLCPKKGSCNTGISNTTGGHTVSLGTFNKLVVYPNAGPQVEFVGGDKCTGSNSYSSTVFMFCDRGIMGEKGRFVYEKGLSIDCHKFFSWWTPVACSSPQISCVIQKPFYDFNPIYPTNGSWQAVDEKTHDKYLINICGPIHSQGTGCSGDAAVCVQRHDGSYQDLGFANTQILTINSNHKPEVHFKGPENCGMVKHSAVVVEMICGLQGLKFRTKDSCVYRFDWYTTFACQETDNLHTQRTCEDYTNQEYSFFPNHLTPPHGAYHVGSHGGGQYHVSLCGDAPKECGGDDSIAVCYTENSNKGSILELGTKDTLSITFDSYWMRFNMTGKDGSVVVTVECAKSDQEYSPTDLEKMSLENEFTTPNKKKTVYFRMYTSEGCNFDSSKIPTDNHPTSPSTGSTSKASSNNKLTFALVIILLVVLLIIAMIAACVLWNRDRREYVFKKVSSIFAIKADEPVKYIRAKTTDAEASLLEESSSEEEPFTTVAATINDNREEKKDGATGKNSQAMKLKKWKKKEEPPLLVDYKDEDEDHLSDEELLNM